MKLLRCISCIKCLRNYGRMTKLQTSNLYGQLTGMGDCFSMSLKGRRSKGEKEKDKLLERRCPTHTQSAEACKKKKKKILDYTKTPKKSSQELSRHWSSYHGFKRSLKKTGLEKGTR